MAQELVCSGYPAPTVVIPTVVTPAPAVPTPVTPTPEVSIKGWLREEVHQLRRLIAHNATATAMLDLTSAMPNQRVPFPRIMERSKTTLYVARAALGGFTQVVRRQFGPDKKWPCEWAQDGDGKSVYWIHPTMAEWWVESAE
jgi:hypothetical protein